MSKAARDRRLVERGLNNAPTVDARNRKASKQFDRWWSGQLAFRFYGDHRWQWMLEPRGQGIIHKGRKP